ncbi:hypothetical protein MNBD_ALPHA04-2403 [hydrothermal vent metagenome]|uniref:YdbS-like PH domain-containing protein n=1 Tax=hydrothermal vent metagenome TaxID=652676 RepID=A0A3B0SDN5_9ZZZZ
MSDIAGGTSDVAQEAAFQHLHPLSIVVGFIRFLSQNIILIGILYFGILDQNPLYTLMLGGGVFVLAILFSYVIWSRFTYQVGALEIRIKSGVISRNNRSIPFERIQDVSLERKPIPRMLGLATVKLETGSGGGEDGKLDSLSLKTAEELRDSIRVYKSDVVAAKARPNAPEPQDEATDNLLFAMDSKRLMIAGLFNFSFVFFAIIAALAQNIDSFLDVPYFEITYWADRLQRVEFVDGLSVAARIAGILGAIFSLILVGIISGVIRTVIRDYGFRLDRAKNGFRRRRGLFTLTDMVMPIHRVQAAILRTGPIREKFGWFHLKFQSLAGDAGGETDHSAAPCANMDEIQLILDETDIRLYSQSQKFLSVHPAFWWRDTIITFLILGAIALGSAKFVHPGLIAIISLWVPITIFLFLGWRRHQYALTDNQIFVRQGWWRRKLTILPRRKIQTVDVGQSPLDHPFNLATVTIGAAGGSALSPIRIMDIPFDQAMVLRGQLI